MDLNLYTDTFLDSHSSRFVGNSEIVFFPALIVVDFVITFNHVLLKHQIIYHLANLLCGEFIMWPINVNSSTFEAIKVSILILIVVS